MPDGTNQVDLRPIQLKNGFYTPLPAAYLNNITQYFGPTDEPLDGPGFGYQHFNRGVDWGVPVGTPLYAVADGVIEYVGWDKNDPSKGYGYKVVLRLADGTRIVYGHLDNRQQPVKAGKKVKAGQVIGYSGNTGASTGPHLSFDVQNANGNPIDPTPFVGFSARKDNRANPTGEWGPAAGGSTGIGGGVTGLTSTNDEIKQGLLQQIRELLKNLNDPNTDPLDKPNILEALAYAEQMLTNLDKYGSINGPNDQQIKDAISTQIDLGTFELNKALQLFNEWNTKQARALEAAINELDANVKHNQSVAAAADYMANTLGYAVSGQPIRYSEPFAQSYKKWRERIEAENPPTAAGVQVPTLPDTSTPSEPDSTQPAFPITDVNGQAPPSGTTSGSSTQEPGVLSADEVSNHQYYKAMFNTNWGNQPNRLLNNFNQFVKLFGIHKPPQELAAFTLTPQGRALFTEWAKLKDASSITPIHSFPLFSKDNPEVSEQVYQEILAFGDSLINSQFDLGIYIRTNKRDFHRKLAQAYKNGQLPDDELTEYVIAMYEIWKDEGAPAGAKPYFTFEEWKKRSSNPLARLSTYGISVIKGLRESGKFFSSSTSETTTSSPSGTTVTGASTPLRAPTPSRTPTPSGTPTPSRTPTPGTSFSSQEIGRTTSATPQTATTSLLPTSPTMPSSPMSSTGGAASALAVGPTYPTPAALPTSPSDPYSSFRRAWDEKWKRGQSIVPLAGGGKDIPPGNYLVGEQGPEHIVTPDGQVMPIGQEGPQVLMAQQGGFDVLPANVPPEQAFLYAKIKQMAAEDKQNEPAKQMAEAEMRARDPQLKQKVVEAVLKAIASYYAVNPINTPKLVGNWSYDPWANWRGLTGVGPDGQPLAQSSGMPIPNDSANYAPTGAPLPTGGGGQQ